MISKWNFQTSSGEELHKRDQLVVELGFNPVICLLLAQRGVTSIEEAKKFSKPSLNDSHDSFLMSDMDKAVRRLNKALGNKEKILIYGDYDVDGTTVVSLVFKYLRPYSSTSDLHIPDRYDEGCGISYKGIDYTAENGVLLIISLDCGIKAIEKIEYAKEKGIDFIIYDHRMPDVTLPGAVAVLGAKHSDSIYSYEHLLGRGVGFKFMQAFAKSSNFPFSDLGKSLGLTAASIASDIVPITGENRILAYYGLKQLNSNPSLGLKGIIDICGLTGKKITISGIVFKISPRINAPDRMMSGKEAAELLLSKDSISAREKSESINQYNEEYRELDRKVIDEANAVIDEVENMDDRKTIVAYNPGWHKGVIGIVASRLTEKYYRLVVALTKSSGLTTGSTRSATGFDIYKAIESCRDLLENFGGHTYVAGLSLREENLEVLTECFLRIASEEIISEQMIPQIDIGAILDLKEINQKSANDLKKMSPFGSDNQKPVSCSLGVKDYGTSKLVGKELEYPKLELIDGNSSTPMHAAVSDMYRYNDHIKGMKPFNICYTVEENAYNGNTSIQLMIKDIKPDDIWGGQVDVYHKILEEYWGYPVSRPLQRDTTYLVCAERDTLGLTPTGGGKSIIFQVPALMMEGICIAVIPLIVLMKDQVENLRRVGIKVTAVYSGMSRQETITQLEDCIFGGYKLLYVSSERFSTDIFRVKMEAMQICLLVVDESHCTSQWRYDFRPPYLNIVEIRGLLPGAPILVLTAMTTPEVVNDIQERLRLKKKSVSQKSFAHKNPAYIVRKMEDKLNTLVYILGKVPDTVIVYVRNRKCTKEIALMLQQAGISADFFHVGLNRDEKELCQARWKNNECRVIVSTNAFGMGIDKPDVRLVVHMDMPGLLEEHYQEAGRRGRDEKKAFAVTLCSSTDSAKLKKRPADESPDRELIYRVYGALGNYYQTAIGYGLNTVHDFLLTDFCSAYKFSLLQTHHALKILGLSGYVEYMEEVDNASCLMLTATRDELYRYLSENKRTDEVIQTILRSYTELFADYVYIDESVIVTRVRVTPHEVYETLVGLSRYRIVNYIPHKKTPLTIYTQTREEQRYLSIPRSAYEEHKERFGKRIEKVSEYISEERACRSRMLLSYLGEEDSVLCGRCDVCLSKHEPQLMNWEFNAIRESLIKTLAGESLIPVKELTEKLPLPQEKILTAIRFLAD